MTLPGARAEHAPPRTSSSLMMQSTWGDRPIYFATTTNAHLDLGLLPHMARQGLAYKLVGPDETAGLERMPMEPSVMQFTGGYFDVQRNQQLFDRVFMFRNMPDRPGLVRRRHARHPHAVLLRVRGHGHGGARFARTPRRWRNYSQRAEGFQKLAQER